MHVCMHEGALTASLMVKLVNVGIAGAFLFGFLSGWNENLPQMLLISGV